MRLKNKKTGEIMDYNPTLERWNGPSKEIKHYVSLAELNAEWEDAPEEPKEYFYIISSGEVNSIFEDEEDEEDTKVCKEIGNYFETRKEAEKAVEKLKAWKRLKDKGLRFTGYTDRDRGKNGQFEIYCEFRNGKESAWQTEVDPLLDLLFGGEE